MKYGVLGMGIMGTPMAENLLKEGNEVVVWNRTREKCERPASLGAQVAARPADVIRECDICFTMVSDPQASHDVCFSEGGVLESICPGKSYIDVSTITPEMAQQIAAAIAERGGRFLEAPVSGSKKPAEDGNLVFLCGGDRSLFEEALPALEIMGKKSFYLGEAGRGAQMKLVINMIMGTMMAAFAEGLSLGDKAGLDQQDIIEVLAQGAIANPMFSLKGPLMADGKFQVAFPLKHMQKDMRLAQLLADEFAQGVSAAAVANNYYIKAKGKGYGDEDFSAVYKAVIDD